MGVGDGFWGRLKQRKLVQWAVAYVAFAFALLQGLDIVAQQFGWPEAVRRGITLVLVIGFFVTLVLAWYHGERGAQKVGGVELLIIALLLAIGGGAMWVYARAPRAAAPMVASSPDGVKRNPGVSSLDGVQRNPVQTIPDSAAGAASSGLRGPTQTIPAKSVAVLPFANESGDKDQQYFSDGLSDDLINALSQFDGLKVISRNSAFQFRNSKDSAAKIGKALGVAHLLEGSVQRAGDEVRITATLVNAADGSIVWSGRYDKPYKDLFALQDAITKAVATALKSRLLLAPGAVLQNDRPPSGNLAAYTAYQHGVAYAGPGTESGLRQAIDAFNEAVQIDPKYAAAYAGLGEAWFNLSVAYLGGAEAAQANAKARAAAAMAAKLDPDSMAARLLQVDLLITDLDWRGAAAAARRALKLAPNNTGAKGRLSVSLATLGQVRQAVKLMQGMLASNPRSNIGYYYLSLQLAALGQLDAARQAIETAISLNPGGNANHEQLAVIEILDGKPKAALAAARQEPPGIWHDLAMALALQVGPDRAAADAALKKLTAGDSGSAGAYQVAEVYALRGDAGNTFKWLDRAWANRDPGISMLLFDPLILRYRNDPRFAAFCNKVGLPDTTDAVAMK